MKKFFLNFLTVVAIIMLVTGTGLILFPPISNSYGKVVANNQTASFDDSVKNIQEGSYEEALKNGTIDKEGYPIDENGKRTSKYPFLFDVDIKRLFEDSIDYNENLKKHQGSLLNSSYSYEVASIDLSSYGISNGIYGYISADTINMNLPVYLGANENTMSYGAAHLTYTSLPVGGKNSNVAIAGHTGYVGRIFFDNIRKLKIGDEVDFVNYWTALRYRVRESKIVEKDKAQDLFISEDEDLLTLITCIRNKSGDFDRYIVICESL